MRKTAICCATAFILSSAGCAGRQPLVQPSERLQISRIVLFQNGLAYIEREGTTDGPSVKLRARRSQIDDVLKSLTIVDHSGDKVASVRILPADEDDETVTLEVGLIKGGAHNVTISYVAEMSGWRPTYRIVAGNDGHVRLQGLAVVDNHSGEPWSDIDLSLSTDLPLSFRYALQSPRPARRPQLSSDGRLLQKSLSVEPGSADTVSLNPVQVASAGPRSDIQAAYSMHNAVMPEVSNRAGLRVRDGVPQAYDGSDESSEITELDETVDPIHALESSEGLDGVVLESHGGFDLHDGESGLVPFVDQTTEGSLVLLYKPATSEGPSSRHPYLAALFRNPLDAPLLTGPVAVYTDDQFLGDGVTGSIPAGSHAFVAYGLSPSMRIEQTTDRGEDNVRAIAIRAGRVRVELQATLETVFRVTSGRASSQQLFLFVPSVEGYQPVQPPDGTIITDAGYFVPAPEGQRLSQVTFELARQRTAEVDLSADPTHPYVPALIELLSSGGDIEVERLIGIADRIEELRVEERRWREDLDVQREALTERRRALESLRDVPANGVIRRRLGASVAQGVAQVDSLTRHLVEGNAEVVTLRQEWYGLLRAMTIES